MTTSGHLNPYWLDFASMPCQSNLTQVWEHTEGCCREETGVYWQDNPRNPPGFVTGQNTAAQATSQAVSSVPRGPARRRGRWMVSRDLRKVALA